MSDKLEQVTEVSENSDLVLGQEMDMKVTCSNVSLITYLL